MQTLGNLFDQEEARLLAQAKADIAAEKQRYNTDPIYRKRVNAERETKFASLSDTINDTEDDEEGEE